MTKIRSNTPSTLTHQKVACTRGARVKNMMTQIIDFPDQRQTPSNELSILSSVRTFV